jgi:hypothetical protein
LIVPTRSKVTRPVTLRVTNSRLTRQLTPQLFTVAPDINPEALMAHTNETFYSASTLTLDLSDDVEGKHRNLALAIYSLMELGLLLVEKALDREIR